MEEQYKNQIREWDQAIARNPYNGESRYRRGVSKSSLHECLESKKPTEIPYTAAVLATHEKLRLQQEALAASMLEDFNEALRLKFTTGDVYFERALVLLNLKRYAEAERDIVRALRNNKPEEDILTFRADIRRKLKDFDGALRDYQQINVVEQDTDMRAMWHVQIARTQFKLKQYGEAIKAAKRALTESANITNAFAYMRGYIKQSAWQTCAESYFALGNLKKEEGSREADYKEGLAALEKYLAIRPDKISMWMLRAKINFMLKNYSAAMKACEKVIYEDGEHEEARVLLEAAKTCRQNALQGPINMPRGEVPPPLPPPCNPAWIPAEGGYAGSHLVGTVFSLRNAEMIRPSAPPLEEEVPNIKVLKRQGSCRIL